MDVGDDDEEDGDDATPPPMFGATLHGVLARRAPSPSTASPSSWRMTGGSSPRSSQSLTPMLPPSFLVAARLGAPRLVARLTLTPTRVVPTTSPLLL
jgi:hypothetical protein